MALQGIGSQKSELDRLSSLDSLEGIVSLETGAPPHWSQRFKGGTLIHAAYPGVLASMTLALAATFLSGHYGAPVMLFGLLFGMAFHFLHEDGRCVAGIEFSSRTILRVGVALLGVRITTGQIASLGIVPILTVIVGVVSTIAIGAVLARRLKLSGVFGVLSGGAVAICGASAALAIASVLPKHPEGERDTILTVVLVTALSTLAMIFYPLVVPLFHLDDVHAGVFLGGTIHDVAQVIGASFMISPVAGDVATYVKLLRVAMLVPVVAVIGWAVARQTSGTIARKGPVVPLFLVAFAVLVVVNSIGLVPKDVAELAYGVSRWCLVTAIAALGMKTSFKSLVTAGWRPLALMVAQSAWIAALVLLSVLVLV